MTVAVTIRIQEADFDIAHEIAALTQGRIDIGAVVTFSGICRGGQETGQDSGQQADQVAGAIAALTLEHYPGMAEAEIGRHVAEAMSRWPLTGVTVIHRVGRIIPGENIVVVLTASAHRQAAFAAAEFLMDYLKASAPFWKREEAKDGTRWVDARSHDDDAAARWTKS
jgi:molybdopterin synthase catalytic subunit